MFIIFRLPAKDNTQSSGNDIDEEECLSESSNESVWEEEQELEDTELIYFYSISSQSLPRPLFPNLWCCCSHAGIRNFYHCSLYSRHDRLNEVIDSGNRGVSKHLGQIADTMTLYEWEGSVAGELGLTPADIAAIKMKYPSELRLQT